MIHYFLKTTHFIPDYHVDTIYDLDFDAIRKQGITVLLFDIDNTIIPYDKHLPDDAIKTFFDDIKKKGFETVLISNNHKPRIKRFGEALELPYVYSAKKPLRSGFKKALKKLPFTPDKQSVMVVGDQLMTDVFGARRSGLNVALVKPLKKKTEKWYTKLNRIIERKMLKKIARRDPETFATLKLDKR